VLYKVGCEPAPLVLGFILGPVMEENLRRSLVISRGDPMVFLERPISAVLLVMTVAVIALIVLPQFRKTREEAFQE
jgi:TctA family transporter